MWYYGWGHFPESGFFNPAEPGVPTWNTDILSLGSIIYTIMTGYWPYRSPGPFRTYEEKIHYEVEVDELFAKKHYPSIEEVVGGNLIRGC